MKYQYLLSALMLAIIVSCSGQKDYSDGKYSIEHRLAPGAKYALELKSTDTHDDGSLATVFESVFSISATADSATKKINGIAIDSANMITGTSDNRIPISHGQFFKGMQFGTEDFADISKREQVIGSGARHMAYLYASQGHRRNISDSIIEKISKGFRADYVMQRLYDLLRLNLGTLPGNAVEPGAVWKRTISIRSSNLGALTFNAAISLEDVDDDSYTIRIEGKFDPEADNGLLGLQPRLSNIIMTGSIDLCRDAAWPVSGRLEVSCEYTLPSPKMPDGINDEMLAPKDIHGKFRSVTEITGSCSGK